MLFVLDCGWLANRSICKPVSVRFFCLWMKWEHRNGSAFSFGTRDIHLYQLVAVSSVSGGGINRIDFTSNQPIPTGRTSLRRRVWQ